MGRRCGGHPWGAHCREGPDASLRALGAAGDGHRPISGGAQANPGLSRNGHDDLGCAEDAFA